MEFPTAARTTWAVLVPVKELVAAKTRLTDLSAGHRADLALAMAADVVEAARAASLVVGVMVVTNDVRAGTHLADLGAVVVADVADAGIDAALTGACRAAGSLWPRSGVAAVSGDLACLDATTLDVVLGHAAAHPRAVLADRHGSGTVVLTARAGHDLRPSYGPASLARHLASGAALIGGDDVDRARLDVDTPADLAAAIELGVGPSCLAMLGARSRAAGM